MCQAGGDASAASQKAEAEAKAQVETLTKKLSEKEEVQSAIETFFLIKCRSLYIFAYVCTGFLFIQFRCM